MAYINNISATTVAEGARFCIGDATAFAVRREGKDIALRIRREAVPCGVPWGTPRSCGACSVWCFPYATGWTPCPNPVSWSPSAS